MLEQLQINKWPNPSNKPQEEFLVDYYVNYGKALMAREIAQLLNTSDKQVEYINEQINKVVNPYSVGTSGKKTTRSK